MSPLLPPLLSLLLLLVPFLPLALGLAPPSLPSASAPPAVLLALLSSPGCHLMPCCYDGLTARLISRSPHGFNVTFQTGFGVAAVNGLSDSGTLGRAENVAAANTVSAALAGAVPCIADGDTGHGSAASIRRTVLELGRAQMAGVMIEDQVSPKRCGHVDGKEVVGRAEAVRRVRIACAARDEFKGMYGAPGPLIVARTDARGVEGGTLEEAIERCREFRAAGADVTFLEAPRSREEMREYCAAVGGPKLYNSLEGGKTPLIGRGEAAEMGYSLAAYPLTLLSASVRAMEEALGKIAGGEDLGGDVLEFGRLKEVVGFGENEELERRFEQ